MIGDLGKGQQLLDEECVHSVGTSALLYVVDVVEFRCSSVAMFLEVKRVLTDTERPQRVENSDKPQTTTRSRISTPRLQRPN